VKFLVDENLSARVSESLRVAGFDAIHILDVNMGGATDIEISEYARKTGRAIISADDDFASLLAKNGTICPSLILLRSADALKPRAQAALLIRNLPSLLSDIEAGSVISLNRYQVRVRRLPISSTTNSSGITIP